MSDLYKTEDGKVFESRWQAESHAEDLARSAKISAEAAKAAAEIAKWANEAVEYAYKNFMDKSDYKGALAFFKKQISENISTITSYNRYFGRDSDIMPHFLYPMGQAYEILGDYNDLIEAIKCYGESYDIYKSISGDGGFVEFYARIRCYIKVCNWKLAKADCQYIMSNEQWIPSGKFNEKMGQVFYWRGQCFENLKNKNMAIFDYKTSADFRYSEASTKLSLLGVNNYKAKKPPKSLRPSGFLAFILGLFSLISAFCIALISTGGTGLSMGFSHILFGLGVLVGVIMLWVRITYKIHPLPKKIIATIILPVFLISGILGFNIIYGKANLQPGTTVIVTDGRMLTEPYGSDVIRIPEGTEVMVTSTIIDLKYVQIEYNGEKGYIDVGYIRKKR